MTGPRGHSAESAANSAGGTSLGQWATLAGALVVCALALTFTRVSGHDTWFQMSVGRLIVESGWEVPHFDVLSHTREGAPWVANEWLGAVTLYLSHQWAGFAGLTLLRVLTVLSMVVAWLLLCRGRPGAIWGVVLLACFALAMAPRFYVQPSLFSSALLLWQIVLVDHALRSRRRWPLFALPPLYVLWINLHSGAATGWLLLGMFVAGLYVQARLRTQEGRLERTDLGHVTPRDVMRVVPWVAAAAVGMLLNPNGLAAITYPLHLAATWVRVSADQVSMLEHLRSYGGSELFNRIVLTAMVVMVAWALSLGRIHLGASLLLLVAGVLAIWRARLFIDFGLLAVALVGPPFGELLASSVRRVAPRFAATPVAGSRRLSWVLTLGLVAGVGLTAALCLPRGAHHRLGFGFDKRQYPAAALDFLASHRPAKGEGFHRREWSGALLWHSHGQMRDYIDGRLKIFDQEFFINDYGRVSYGYEQEPSWSQILESHDVTWILLDRRDPNTLPLRERLYVRQEAQSDAARTWSLVWFDDTALVFFKRDAFDAETWRGLALGFRADQAWMKERDAGELRLHPEWRQKLVTMMEENPDNSTAVELLLIAEEKLGLTEHRAEVLERLLAFEMPPAERSRTEHALGLLRLQEGDAQTALGYLRAARRSDPGSVEIALSLAGLLWQLRMEEETVTAYEEVLALDPGNPEASEALRAHRDGTLWDEHPDSAVPEGPQASIPANLEIGQVVS